MSKKHEQLLENLEYASGNGRIPEEYFTKYSKNIKPLKKGQEDYIEAVRTSIITLCDGPAGTGKTHISVGIAMEMLLAGEVNRVVFSRPALECGQKMGFLPGDAKEKFSPYMRPIIDIILNFISKKDMNTYIENDTIEFCPLAYMRGRTIHKAAMVLDEAQNATEEELLMFMTRIGTDSRMIISGDSSQCDLHKKEDTRAFRRITRIFDTKPYIDGIRVVYLSGQDVVRHGIITEIIKKFEEACHLF